MTESAGGRLARPSTRYLTGEPGEMAGRIAHSHALFREVNERINEIAGDFELAEGFSILCECASTQCRERIELTRAEYEHLRQMPNHFAVVRDHDVPEVERIAQENDRFVTVEKLNHAGRLQRSGSDRRR